MQPFLAARIVLFFVARKKGWASRIQVYDKFKSVSRVAAELGVTDALVTMYLPYERTVYDLEDRSGNAKRIRRWRERKSRKPTRL